MKESETPIPYVKLWNIGGLYNHLDLLAAEKDAGLLKWPDFCPIPSGIAEGPVSAEFPDWDTFTANVKSGSVSAAIACWAWAKTKIVYQFDLELMETLANQAEKAEENAIPAEILVNLPYRCIFIKAPISISGEAHAPGFFVWVDVNETSKTKDLHFLAGSASTGRWFSSYIQLHSGKTVQECIDLTISFLKNKDDYYKEIGYVEREWAFQKKAIQWILYLVSENADIESGPPPELDNPQKAKKSRKKKSAVKVKNVGFRIGATIRKAKAAPAAHIGEPSHGSKKSPHSRRGHWHHYWTGPRDGERKLVLKWVAPTFINTSNKKADTVVVYPVK